MKRKEISQDDIVNWWLSKYHDTTLEQVAKDYPELKESRDFYDKFPVTEEQHDEWYEWAIDFLSKYFRCGKKRMRKMFVFDYLNCAPKIKKNKKI